MTIIGRLFMVLIAYVLASLAASIVLAVGALTPQWDQWAPQSVPGAVLWSLIAIGGAVIAAVALLPAIALIALAEGFAWRSVILYGALGGLLALALRYGIDFVRDSGAPERILPHGHEVIAASGIAGGLVYWAFAGRKAGSWK
jgi:hypothetical protein